MKKFATLLLLLLAFGLPPMRAQTIPATANITASDSGTCATAGACLTVNLPGNSASSVIQLTGTFSATLQFEGTTSQGGTFVAVSATPVGGGSAVNSATATGAWRVTTSGLSQIRVRCSAFTSGTAVASITQSPGSSGSGAASGGGSFTAGQDLTGTSSAQTVVGLETLPLPTLAAMTGCLFDNAGTLQLVTGCQSGISSVAAYFTTTGGVLKIGTATTTAAAFAALAPIASAGQGDLMISNSSQVWVDFVHNTTGTNCLSEDNTGAASWQPCGGANTTLSNLGTTALNADLLCASAGSCNLGSLSLPFNNLYFSGSIVDTANAPWLWAGVEGSCSGATPGKDVLCIGDSATHQALESDNGGTFYPLLKGSGSFTATHSLSVTSTNPLLVQDSGGVGTQTIASGTAALGTSLIAASACATPVTVTATGVATTDNIIADFNADPTSTTGYIPGAMLTIVKYSTSGNVNFKVCNNSGSGITPSAVTLNWRVVR